MTQVHYKKNSPEVMIRLLFAMAYADNYISEEENLVIARVIEENNFVEVKVDLILNDLKQYNDLSKIFIESINLIDDHNIRKKTLSILGELATSDHVLHENELFFLQLVAQKWGMYVTSLESFNKDESIND